MGNDANARSKGARKPVGGSDAAGQRRFGSAARNSASARFSAVSELAATLDALIGTGDALMLSRTSDGGAIVLTLLRDQKREKVYAAKQDELDEAFTWLREEYMGG